MSAIFTMLCAPFSGSCLSKKWDRLGHHATSNAVWLIQPAEMKSGWEPEETLEEAKREISGFLSNLKDVLEFLEKLKQTQ